MHISSSYLSNVYDPARFPLTIKAVLRELRSLRRKAGFDAIAFRGSSGAAAAYPAAGRLGCGLIHVRKDMGHSFMEVEGAYDVDSYVIVDDFISNGDTVRSIVARVDHNQGYRGTKPRPVLRGIVLYSDGGDGRVITGRYARLLEDVGHPDAPVIAARW